MHPITQQRQSTRPTSKSEYETELMNSRSFDMHSGAKPHGVIEFSVCQIQLPKGPQCMPLTSRGRLYPKGKKV